jgi:hypothetical protein
MPTDLWSHLLLLRATSQFWKLQSTLSDSIQHLFLNFWCSKELNSSFSQHWVTATFSICSSTSGAGAQQQLQSTATFSICSSTSGAVAQQQLQSTLSDSNIQHLFLNFWCRSATAWVADTMMYQQRNRMSLVRTDFVFVTNQAASRTIYLESDTLTPLWLRY